MSETSESEHVSPQGILKKPRPVQTATEDDLSLQRPLHMRPFKLRFAPRKDLGRSYVSLVKPLGLEATVTQKFHTQSDQGELEVSDDHVEQVFKRIEEKFQKGPREKYDAPMLTSHMYGWWWEYGTNIPKDPRLNHHIRDSYWLKSKIAVLTADQKLKRK